MTQGRPSLFSQELADTICERLVEGKSLRAICRDDEMPAIGTIMRWLTEEDKKAFSEQYARAREAQADTLFDEILEIADGTKAMLEGCDPDVQRDRLSVDARKWMAGKLKGKYSDKTKHEHSGPDGAPIAFTGLEVTFVDPSVPGSS